MTPRTMERRIILWAAIVCCVILPVASARDPAAPETIVLENISIIAGDPGRPRMIEKGAIVIRDGLLEQIVDLCGDGTGQLEIPPGARCIDGSGLHAVPAFIDAYTTAGTGSQSPSRRNAGRAPDEREGPLPWSHEARRGGLTPEWSVLAGLDPGSAELDAHRRAGFAAINAAPAGGFLSGRAALVSLSGAPAREVIVNDRTGISGSLSARSSSYPRSLMGVFAHLRQCFLDAGHYRRWHALYDEDPLGLRRPPVDTTLEAVTALQRRELPLVLEAESEGSIRRALRLAGELRVDLIVAGGREASRAAPALGRARAGVVLLANYPERPELSSVTGALPRRVQQERRGRWLEEVLTATKLHESGVRFAWGTGAKKDPAALVKSLRRALAAGLDSGLALRALTLSAAELFGVSRVLGSLEAGKIASVAVFDAPPATADAKVRYLIVDGRLFDYSPDKKKPADAATETAAEKKPDGKPDPTTPVAKEDTPEISPDDPTQHCELDDDRRPALVTGGTVFIKNATVLTCAGETMAGASIRIRDGRIEAVGPDVESMGITPVIDATGLYVMPGIIDCHSHMAISGGVNEASESITCEVRIRDVINPHDVGLYRALAGGVTAAHLLHGSANTIGGQCALVKLKYGRSREEMLVDRVPQTVKFALGENVKQSNRSRRGTRFPATRMGVEATLRRAFTAAREYEGSWRDHAGRLARGERSLEPRRDLRLEALLKILGGEILVHSHCYRADEILMLMRVAENFGFRVATLQHVLEGYKVAPEIALHGAGASTFSDWWAYKIEAFNAIPHNATLMTRAGVVVSINSDSSEEVRHLNLEAAKAVRYGGLSEDQALALVTLNPARQLRIDQRVGSVEPGKDADLAIFDAHPLSVYARCRYTLIEGEVYFQSSDTEANAHADRRRVRPADLLPAALVENARGLYAVRGARIVPVDGEPIEPGTVVIADGVIAAVGTVDAVAIPAGSTVIDGAGLEVHPGFIDAGSDTGLTEIGSVRGSVDLGETGTVQPDLAMISAVNIHSEIIATTRASGITTTAVFNRGGLIAGQAGVIRLSGSSTPEATVRAVLGLQVNLPRLRRDQEKEPESVKEIERWFERARRFVESGDPVDLRIGALLPYVRRELPVIFSAQSELQIRLAVRLADELDVRAIVRGGRDAWRVAGLLKEKGIPVIVGPVETLPGERHDPYDAPYANPARLHAAGVAFAFQSDDATSSRNLAFGAGIAVAHGLPSNAAIRALTLGAAEILGLADRRGSITRGKVADLVITDGDPLEITSHVRYVFISGRAVSLESRHTRLYRAFRDRIRPRQKPASREF